MQNEEDLCFSIKRTRKNTGGKREEECSLGFKTKAQHGANAADATDPPLPQGRETGEQEPEDHSAELLKRVLAGKRETDISRVKLAKMPTPTGSRSSPPVKAWQDWFTIRLRTWANVISPEFEAELVK